MGNPRLSVEIRKRRWYRNPNRDAERLYWSVTVATRALPSEGLKYWAAREVASYAVSRMGEWSDLPAMEAQQKLAAAPWAIRDAAGLKGREVHTVLERMIEGADYGLEAKVDPLVKAAAAFVRECRPVPELVEATVFNDRHGYAGTFDFVGTLKGLPALGRCLIDWKTSRSVHNDMGVQCHAYARAEYLVDDQDQEREWVRPDTLLIVHLTPDGYRLHPVPGHPGYFRAFLAALELRRWERDVPGLQEPLDLPLDPAQQRFDTADLAAQVRWLKALIKDLGPDVGLKLSARCVDLGIPTRPSLMDAEDADALLGLVRLAEAGKL